MKNGPKMSRREREIMDIVYAAGSATALEIRERMPEAPSYSAVRGTLRILEQKGMLRHDDDGTRYVYKPTVRRERARQGAVQHLIRTFFDGSPANAVLALLEEQGNELTEDELQRVAALIERARREGR